MCGIRGTEDLRTAIGAGVDAVGFISGVTHFSEDALDASVASTLVNQTPPFVSTVLVTHLENADAILDLADRTGVDTIQIHGLVSHATVADVFRHANGRRITKAIHVMGSEAIREARRFADICHALHLDSRTHDRLGGTGKTHDWSISAQVTEEMHSLGVPVIVSGGLCPENVRDAVYAMHPFAVDVNSGVETERGDKDPKRVAAFVSLANAGAPKR
ncbi:MAG: phosphoribosylanthranilate isomerase [Actinobacteria bacterium]|nr:phosphoribosylanthranilate isomerase [Actinomycetota bacterium]